MRPLYQTNQTVSVALTTTIVIWIALEVLQAMRTRKDGVVRDNGSRQVFFATTAGGIVLAMGMPRRLPQAAIVGPHALILAVGLALLWSGIVLRLWSIRTLGRYFTLTVMTSGDQKVVDRGPYHVLRHPGYAGALAALAGMGFMIGNWASVAVILGLPLVGIINRIRVEEGVLCSSLGDRYVAYAAGRKRLVPFVW